MDNHETNGKLHFIQRFDRIDGEIKDLRDDLASAVRELTHAVNRLADKVDSFGILARTAVPIKIVFFMFLILVLALAGVEGVQALFKLHMAH